MPSILLHLIDSSRAQFRHSPHAIVPRKRDLPGFSEAGSARLKKKKKKEKGKKHHFAHKNEKRSLSTICRDLPITICTYYLFMLIYACTCLFIYLQRETTVTNSNKDESFCDGWLIYDWVAFVGFLTYKSSLYKPARNRPTMNARYL